MFKCALLGSCLIFFLSGCAVEPLQLQQRINEAYDFEVTHCDSFALVTGVSRHANNLAEAKQSAALQGQELGGTHIVWLQTDMGDPTKVVAIVYKCLL
uniref:Lipoprotein n=1 Tax=Shewanella sp. (strain MR-7) TaxID=60481 RepID=Q0HXE4_SHESR